jgi:hypothetical protein
MATLQPGGEPRLITKRFLKNLGRLIAAGCPPLQAAIMLGVHRSTWFEWLGAIGRDNPDNPISNRLRDLRDTIDVAEATHLNRLIINATRGATTTKDNIDLIKLRYPTAFNQQAKEETDDTVAAAIIEIHRRMAMRALPQGNVIDVAANPQPEEKDGEV